jgi:MFS family permease
MQCVIENRENSSVRKALMPWIICFVASLFFFYEFIQGNMFASIADNVMTDFGIQAGKMTYLSSVYYLSNIIFLFLAGILLDRFSTKKIILFAMFLCVVSTFIFAHAQSFYLALTCRFITGIGSAFCFLGPIRIASRWFPPHKMALVAGAIVTMAMTGGLIAQYPLTCLVNLYGWREALIMVGWLGVAMLFIMTFWIKDKPEETSVQPRGQHQGLLRLLKQAYFNLNIIRAAFYTSLVNMSVAVFGAMMGSLYLIQRLGVTKEEAALVNSMLFLGAIVGGPLIGWVSDRMGKRVLPMKIGAAASLLTFLAILYLPASVNGMSILFFLLGFFTASQVISYALVAESTSPLITATAVSVISFLTQGGYIVYQNIFSVILMWHGDMHMIKGVPTYSLNDYQSAALIMPIGLTIALALISKLKETHCKPIQG